MSIDYGKYELVIGLEVHAQLLTKSKLFSGDATSFGADPNTHISPITLAHPGTLPKLNEQAISHAIKMGLACNCEITRLNYFARKNYFYPDLPKGYQLSQHTTPICVGGWVNIQVPGENARNIQLNRIHLEEDAGKSIHDIEEDYTCIDYNRAGVPLIEIVTEPDLHSGEEAYAYLTELRKRLRYLEVCDGNMEEGSMRCDANVSVRLKGATQLGTKVEVKNLNSIRNVKKAIEFEAKRLIEIIESGNTVIQQTRSFDANNGTTFELRTKEDANDYRYFADPDLTPFIVKDELLEEIRKNLPELSMQRSLRYVNQLGLNEYDANLLTEEKEIAHFFEQSIQFTNQYKGIANWIAGPIKSYLNEQNSSIQNFPIAPQKIAEIVEWIEKGKINFSIASTKLFSALLNEPNATVENLISSLNLEQNSDSSSIEQWVDQVLTQLPEKVKEYQKGKKGLIGLFMGEVKKISKGKADPKITNEILLRKLQS
jgi:aspartyl-tRNA(Asn)/glutamyl-tRNA(Gln) amidotransferase subunit B